MDNIEEYISEEKIKKEIITLAKKINTKYKNNELYVISILKGAFMFTSDIVKNLTLPVVLDFMIVSSYESKTETTGIIKIKKDIDVDIKGKDVLIIDDIVDSGLTLNYLSKHLSKKGPKSISYCTLFSKVARRKVDVNVDFIGFEIDNEFIVGYGLDYNQKYRNLPYIGKLKFTEEKAKIE